MNYLFMVIYYDGQEWDQTLNWNGLYDHTYTNNGQGRG